METLMSQRGRYQTLVLLVISLALLLSCKTNYQTVNKKDLTAVINLELNRRTKPNDNVLLLSKPITTSNFHHYFDHYLFYLGSDKSKYSKKDSILNIFDNIIANLNEIKTVNELGILDSAHIEYYRKQYSQKMDLRKIKFNSRKVRIINNSSDRNLYPVENRIYIIMRRPYFSLDNKYSIIPYRDRFIIYKKNSNGEWGFLTKKIVF
jgi:hypothetical protein